MKLIHQGDNKMKKFAITYILNNDLQPCFIEIEAADEISAIKSLRRMGARILLNFKITSCRLERRRVKRNS